MLVDTGQRAEPLLVGPVRGSQKTRLPQQPLGAAIVVGIEACDEQFFISIDALPLPPKLVVEPHHLGDEPGTQLKRRSDSRIRCLPRRGVEDDFALAAGQDVERRLQPRVEEQVELVSRDDCRRLNFVETRKVMASTACRHDDCRRCVSGGRVRSRTGNDGLPERLKVRDTDQPRTAGRNQGACGLRSCVRISLRARAPSISAPAAAEDASHARSTLLASVASRRIRAAFSAMWTALTNTACAAVSSSGGEITADRSRIQAIRRSRCASVDGDEPASDLMSSSAGRSVAKMSSGG